MDLLAKYKRDASSTKTKSPPISNNLKKMMTLLNVTTKTRKYDNPFNKALIFTDSHQISAIISFITGLKIYLSLYLLLTLYLLPSPLSLTYIQKLANPTVQPSPTLETITMPTAF